MKRVGDVRILSDNLLEFSMWFKKNDLVVSTNKCKAITFWRLKTFGLNLYVICDLELELVDYIKDLGVIFDNNMSFYQHIDTVIGELNEWLSFLNRLCREMILAKA